MPNKVTNNSTNKVTRITLTSSPPSRFCHHSATALTVTPASHSAMQIGHLKKLWGKFVNIKYKPLAQIVQASRSQARNFLQGIPDTPATIGVIDRNSGINLPTHSVIGADRPSLICILARVCSRFRSQDVSHTRTPHKRPTM